MSTPSQPTCAREPRAAVGSSPAPAAKSVRPSAPRPPLAQRSREAKERLEMILEVLTGKRSVKDASASLGITPQHFDTLCKRFLQG